MHFCLLFDKRKACACKKKCPQSSRFRSPVPPSWAWWSVGYFLPTVQFSKMLFHCLHGWRFRRRTDTAAGVSAGDVATMYFLNETSDHLTFRYRRRGESLRILRCWTQHEIFNTINLNYWSSVYVAVTKVNAPSHFQIVKLISRTHKGFSKIPNQTCPFPTSGSEHLQTKIKHKNVPP